jgi:hypothetical protein
MGDGRKKAAGLGRTGRSEPGSREEQIRVRTSECSALRRRYTRPPESSFSGIAASDPILLLTAGDLVSAAARSYIAHFRQEAVNCSNNQNLKYRLATYNPAPLEQIPSTARDIP